MTSAINFEDFRLAVEKLEKLEAKPLAGNFAVAIAALAHRGDNGDAQLSEDGTPITTQDLQSKVCDRSWAKQRAYLPSYAEGEIYKPFTLSFKPAANNNWRNSFDLQGGIGCEAPLERKFLLSEAYISESRLDCALRDESSGRCTASPKRTICFNPAKRGITATPGAQAKARPKILRRDARGRGFNIIRPTSESLVGLLATPSSRIPATPFAHAFFGGSQFWQTSSGDDLVARLQRTLGLSNQLFLTLFETREPLNFSVRSAVTDEPSIDEATATQLKGRDVLIDPPGPEAGSSVQSPSIPGPVDYVARDTEVFIELAGYNHDPDNRRRLLEQATRGHRRILNTLAENLRSAGIQTVQELPGSFDLFASDGKKLNIIFEAKTWTETNLASQVRSGRAQLEEYAYRNREIVGPSPTLALIFDREPPSDFWAWQWFSERHSPHVLWVESGHTHGLGKSNDWIRAILNSPDPSDSPISFT